MILSIIDTINLMSDSGVAVMPINAGAAFYGFMGVSLALVLASTPSPTQTSEQHMALPRPAPASAASRSGGPEWS